MTDLKSLVTLDYAFMEHVDTHVILLYLPKHAFSVMLLKDHFQDCLFNVEAA